MPKRKRTSYSNRRKRRKFKGRFRRRFRRPSRIPSAIKPRNVRKLRYVDAVTISSASGLLASYDFRASSIYDPDITGTGHQPIGHDQMNTFYNHYVVLGSKIRCYFTSDTGTVTTRCGVYLADDQSTGISANSLIEMKRGGFSIITHQRRSAKASTAYSAKKFFSVSNVRDNVDRLGANMGADPSEIAVFKVWQQAFDTTTQTLRCTVVIDYVVLFSEPKDIGAS